MDEILKQFTLRQFPVALMMGDTNIYMYQWSTLDGLMRIGREQNALQLIAVQNAKPHNGEFLRLIKLLESTADNYGMSFTVSDFFNDRLRRWFIARGYAYVKKYDTVVYKHKNGIANVSKKALNINI